MASDILRPSFSLEMLHWLSTLAIFALGASATPLVVRNAPISLSLARHVNHTAAASGKSILEAAQARARQIASPTNMSPEQLRRKMAHEPVTNQAIGYTVDVRVSCSDILDIFPIFLRFRSQLESLRLHVSSLQCTR